MSQPSDTIQIDLQQWLSTLAARWWLIVLCLLIALGIGNFYLRYATYQYRTSAILLIKDTGKDDLISTESILLSQNYSIGSKGMDNEVQILRSSPLMKKVVERLNLHISYFRQGRFKEHEFYGAQPFHIDTFALRSASASFYIELVDKTSFLVISDIEDEENGIRQEYGKGFETENGYFKFSAEVAEKIVPGTYRITIEPIENVATRYRNNLVIERVGSIISSSMLMLILNDPVPKKAEDILTTLIDVYNQEEVRDESKVLLSTLDFIDDRLRILESELDFVEGSIEIFRRQNAVVNETASESRSYAVSELRATLNEIARLETKKDLLLSIEKFVKNENDSFRLLPTNLITDNPSLGNLVLSYNELVLQLERLSNTASSVNPTRQAVENELLELRASLLESIQNIQQDMNIPLTRLARSVQELEAKMLSVPGIEKELLEQKRLQSIKENLYLTLLQKREETALSIAIATAGNRTVEPASSTKKPVQPQERLVYLACILLGLFIPVIGLIIYAIADTKISSEDTIKRLTNFPIMGRILHHTAQNNVVVHSGDRSAINEMFRQLRTNLNYLNIKHKKQIFAITSYVSGEGKSFIALNLALTYSLSNKKTILLELDLRKPKLIKYMGITPSNVGITSYLIGEKSLSEIIQTYQNLDFISSGPIPPNPSELISSDRMESLLQILSAEYDCIIIDNPPIGLVSDALLLRKYVTDTLLIIRHKFSERKTLRHLEEMRLNDELPNSSIVINGIKLFKNGYYGYNSYGYAEEYYE
jgi:capsular exopolysaccharide synthesis family protein